MLVSVDTVKLVALLEPELFKRFGWTMRVFVNEHGYVTFTQMMMSYGHIPLETVGKPKSNERAIEIYLLSRSIDRGPSGPVSNIPVVKDLWMGGSFAESMMLPPNRISFKSAATSAH